MWQANTEWLDNKRVCKITLLKNQQTMMFSEVFAGWKNDAAFREFYCSIIAGSTFQALFWETPPIVTHTIHQPYECVLVDSPALSKIKANSAAFADYFTQAKDDESVLVFENLGKDALLLVPCPQGPSEHYIHLAQFIRYAPRTQCHIFFSQLATAIEQRLSDRALWISTSGLGVYWLHVRLDSRPKYYTFSPYRNSAR